MSKNLGFFRSLACRTLSYEKFRHSIGVEAMAAELAERHGLNVEAARFAGITHDLAKPLSFQEQIKKAEEYNLLYYPEDRENPQVLHGRIAAYMLEQDYGISDRDILNAVANHTLGRPGMSPLEMLIYSTDLTEPGRYYDGVDKLREKLYYDLKQGTFACIEHTINYLLKTGGRVHPLTVLTYEDFK